MKPTLEQIREVRSKTGLGLLEVVNAFKLATKTESVYDILKARGVEIAESKQKRDAGVSRLHSYIHNGKFGAMVKFRCETDFVAKSEEYQQFMQDICMHVAATPLPFENIWELIGWFDEFGKQPFVKDFNLTVADVVAEISAKTGEKIEVARVCRYTV
jgi:elongation factor Ts